MINLPLTCLVRSQMLLMMMMIISCQHQESISAITVIKPLARRATLTYTRGHTLESNPTSVLCVVRNLLLSETRMIMSVATTVPSLTPALNATSSTTDATNWLNTVWKSIPPSQKIVPQRIFRKRPQKRFSRKKTKLLILKAAPLTRRRNVCHSLIQVSLAVPTNTL